MQENYDGRLITGVHINKAFVGSFRDAYFDGSFIGCDFTQADVTGAQFEANVIDSTFNETAHYAIKLRGSQGPIDSTIQSLGSLAGFIAGILGG